MTTKALNSFMQMVRDYWLSGRPVGDVLRLIKGDTERHNALRERVQQEYHELNHKLVRTCNSVKAVGVHLDVRTKS